MLKLKYEQGLQTKKQKTLKGSLELKCNTD